MSVADSIGLYTASIVPFEPATTIITAVAGIFLVVTIAVLVFLALAPELSDGWGSALNPEDSASPDLDPSEAD